MRNVRFSQTFLDQLHDLLGQGVDRFGLRVVAEKKARVYDVIEHHLAQFPATTTRNPHLGLYSYPISRTPFVVIYDFDEHELRVHFVIHQRADRSRIDPKVAIW